MFSKANITFSSLAENLKQFTNIWTNENQNIWYYLCIIKMHIKDIIIKFIILLFYILMQYLYQSLNNLWWKLIENFVSDD
jgi:hypothetical protein